MKNINKMDMIVSGSGLLTTDDQHGVVHLSLAASDGAPPKIGKLYGDTNLLEAAWEAGHATLDAFGATMRIEITGFDMQDGALAFPAAPVFEALAETVKSAA